MQYIVMDLEWNNVYVKKTSRFMNEIIEIGAVKLNSDLDTVDTFSCIIRSQIGRKLRGSVKELTHLTNADILTGTSFTKTFSHFRKWIGNEETCVITWGDSDIRVLIENYSYLNGINTVPFLSNYCDLQKYYQHFIKSDHGQQIGLVNAAVGIGLNPDLYTHHRALGDSLLTSDIFEQIFDENLLKKEVLVCDKDFYSRLMFKPHIIKTIDSSFVDKKRLEHFCEMCGSSCKRISKWKFSGQFFKADFYCDKCNTKYNIKVRFKKTYDGVDYKKVVSVAED
ncbi:MAG: exonuclease domain-containing protein [Clostridiales bacterium]|nr:exonuclease domain-containing protein [Clostridiales bacterium]